MRVFDLAAAATVVDIGRHQPKLISDTRPLGHSAAQPRRYVAFLDKPRQLSLFLILTQSKFQTITRSVHGKFNCINVKYNGTRQSIYILEVHQKFNLLGFVLHQIILRIQFICLIWVTFLQLVPSHMNVTEIFGFPQENTAPGRDE